MSEEAVLSIDTESTGGGTSPSTSVDTLIGNNDSPQGESESSDLSETTLGSIVSKKSLNSQSKMQLDQRHINYLKRKGITLNEPLAAGTFSQVYKIKSQVKKQDAKTAALKIIKIQMKKPNKFKFLKREIKALRNLTHGNIVAVHKVFKSSTMVYIVMDHMQNGTIHDYLRIKGPVSEARATKWLKEITTALEYIHNSGWAHRDIKVENIGLNAYLEAKLLDFGFARECRDPQTREFILAGTKCGSIPYVSPESIVEEMHDPKLADQWSLGVTLYVTVVKKFPFSPRSLQHLHEQQVSRIWRVKMVYSNMSIEFFDLLNSLLEPNHQKRVTASQLLAHPLLESLRKEERNNLDDVANGLKLDTNTNK